MTCMSEKTSSSLNLSDSEYNRSSDHKKGCFFHRERRWDVILTARRGNKLMRQFKNEIEREHGRNDFSLVVPHKIRKVAHNTANSSRCSNCVYRPEASVQNTEEARPNSSDEKRLEPVICLNFDLNKITLIFFHLIESLDKRMSDKHIYCHMKKTNVTKGG